MPRQTSDPRAFGFVGDGRPSDWFAMIRYFRAVHGDTLFVGDWVRIRGGMPFGSTYCQEQRGVVVAVDDDGFIDLMIVGVGELRGWLPKQVERVDNLEGFEFDPETGRLLEVIHEAKDCSRLGERREWSFR